MLKSAAAIQCPARMTKSVRSQPLVAALRVSLLLIGLAGCATHVSVKSSDLPTAVACDHQCLRSLADRYIESLVRHGPQVLPLSPVVRFTENGKVLQIGQGAWRTVGGTAGYRAYVADPETGQVAAHALLTERGDSVLLMLRLKVFNREITEIETFVVHHGETGDWAPERLASTTPVYDQVVPAGERQSRAELLRITDSYFTALQTQGTPDYRPAPFAPGANRFENGLKATNDSSAQVPLFRMTAAEQFDRGMFRGRRVEDRRYPVVDVERGTVLAIVTFRMPQPGSSVLLLSELFKIGNGKIQEIRAVQLDRPHDAVIGWP